MLALSTMIDPDCRDPPNKTFSWWLVDVIFLLYKIVLMLVDGGFFFFFTEKCKVLYLFLKFYWCTVDLLGVVFQVYYESVRHVLSLQPNTYTYLRFFLI